MEYINRIELQGVVGATRSDVIGTSSVQSFSLMTEYMFENSDKSIVCEATWHSIVAWNSKAVNKGDKVRVVGRLRQTKYTAADGTERIFCEVVASELKIIER